MACHGPAPHILYHQVTPGQRVTDTCGICPERHRAPAVTVIADVGICAAHLATVQQLEREAVHAAPHGHPRVTLPYGLLCGLLLALVTACGRDVSPTAPPVTTQRATSCTLTKILPLNDGRTVTLTGYFTPCPSDSTIAAGGWTKNP